MAPNVTDDAVTAVVRRRRLPEGESLARRVVDAVGDWTRRSGLTNRPAGARCPGERVSQRRAHLAGLEADRSMARLGFRLHDIARGDAAESVRDERTPDASD